MVPPLIGKTAAIKSKHDQSAINKQWKLKEQVTEATEVKVHKI